MHDRRFCRQPLQFRTELVLDVVMLGCLVVTSGQFPGTMLVFTGVAFLHGRNVGALVYALSESDRLVPNESCHYPDKSGLLTAIILVLLIGCTWLPASVPAPAREDSMASRCLGAGRRVRLRFFRRRPQSPLSFGSAGYSRVVPFVGSALYASISRSQVFRIWFCHRQFGGGRQSV
jgi:hypothetical protein